MSTAIQIDSRREVLSDQQIRWCCIDRLSWQDFSGLGQVSRARTLTAMSSSIILWDAWILLSDGGLLMVNQILTTSSHNVCDPHG
jgi:hypothetical protein